ncbi:MAG: hypothetical protein HC915_00700 [Anaerolineae bacterium]|nr:hypothetical protein [Anaerolineae bacterium]
MNFVLDTSGSPAGTPIEQSAVIRVATSDLLVDLSPTCAGTILATAGTNQAFDVTLTNTSTTAGATLGGFVFLNDNGEDITPAALPLTLDPGQDTTQLGAFSVTVQPAPAPSVQEYTLTITAQQNVAGAFVPITAQTTCTFQRVESTNQGLQIEKVVLRAEDSGDSTLVPGQEISVARPGDDIFYRITLTSLGGQNVRQIEVSDPLLEAYLASLPPGSAVNWDTAWNNAFAARSPSDGLGPSPDSVTLFFPIACQKTVLRTPP